MKLLSLAVGLGIALGARSHNEPHRVPVHIATHPFVTQIAKDSAGVALGRLAVQNVDSLVFAELHVWKQENRFTTFPQTIYRAGYRRMPGLNLRVIAGETWLVIYASLPGVVTISQTGIVSADERGVAVGVLGTDLDSVAFERKP